MRSLKLPLPVLAVLALLLCGVTVAQEGGGEDFNLSHKPVRKWTTCLPSETWTDVAGEIPVGPGFAVTIDGVKLRIDGNGDGRPDQTVRGVGGQALLKAKTEDGVFAYTVRFRKKGKSWQWSTSGVMAGRVQGERIELIDQNGNGHYDEFGVDAIVVGRDRAAGYLSKVVNLRGDLYEFSVAADGSKVTTTPYEGDVGTLDLRSGFKVRGRLEAAIVSHEDMPGVSFNVASHRRGLEVPAGRYTLVSGKASRGSETVLIRAGEMEPVTVAKDETTSVEWGAPVVADVDWTQQGTNVKVDPNQIQFYGKAGEEYHTWLPDTQSPKLLIKDAETGRLLETGRFGGC